MNTVELDRGTSDSKYVFAQKKKNFMSKLKEKKTPNTNKEDSITSGNSGSVV